MPSANSSIGERDKCSFLQIRWLPTTAERSSLRYLKRSVIPVRVRWPKALHYEQSLGGEFKNAFHISLVFNVETLTPFAYQILDKAFEIVVGEEVLVDWLACLLNKMAMFSLCMHVF
jgi:hypothetical protein